MTHHQRSYLHHFPRTAIAIAVSLAITSYSFADANEEVTNLISPSSFVSAGAGYVSSQGGPFGIYNGLHRDGAVGLLDFSYVSRNEETGTWLRASGRNLGLNTRELRAEYEHQGRWGVFVDYNEISRVSPYTVTSNVQGIGSAYQTVPSVAAATHQFTLKTERDRSSVGFNATLAANTEFRMLFQNEDKKGTRLFGRGTTNAMEFLAEPINTNTKQLDLVLDYTGEKLQLSGGYYGSYFNNHNTALRVAGGSATFGPATSPSVGVMQDTIALPPDNQAHQFHLAGGYQLDKTTRLNFKVGRSVALQNDEFAAVRFSNNLNTNGASANTSGRHDLGGRVTTTLASVGLTSRPIRNLFLLGNIRFEERDDQTALARYITNVTGTPAVPVTTPFSATGTAADRRQSTDGFNEPRSLKNWAGKLEASYSLPEGYRISGGYDYDNKERSTAGIRVVGYRTKVEENTYRLELKRAMSESITGSLAYAYSERRGSNYFNLTTLGGYTYPNYANADQSNCGLILTRSTDLSVTRCGLLQPIYLADRDRQRVRLLTDWAPTDELSIQLALEASIDQYKAGRGSPNIGVRHGDSWLYSVDVSYQANERWRLNTWLSRTDSSIEQASISASPNMTNSTFAANAGAIVWNSDQRNSVDSIGIGARGKLLKGIELGADLIYSYDRTRYNVGKERYSAFNNNAVPSGLPDIKYEQQTLKLFGTYPIDKNLTARLDYIVDRRKIDDWTWNNWNYTDGTRIGLSPASRAYLIGMSIQYAFR